MTTDDIANQECLPAVEVRGRAIRRWLEEAWRHGEVVADEDRPFVATPVRPVDRFVVAQERPYLAAPEHDQRWPGRIQAGQPWRVRGRTA